jgi:hypothetical protein
MANLYSDYRVLGRNDSISERYHRLVSQSDAHQTC